MFLEKDGVKLYYEVRGEGAPLLMIHGVMVDAWLYERAGELLAKHYRVITYDRRGNSRSEAAEGTRYDMDAQIADVKNLLDELGIAETYIAGTSAGGSIGLHFLLRYPERVKKLIAYEPALLMLETENKESEEWIGMMEDLIARKKYAKATLRFVESIGTMDERAPEKPGEISMREMRNMENFLVNEYSEIIRYCPDPAQCRNHVDKIIVAVGEKSGDAPYASAAKHFAGLIGAPLLYYPGYHNLPSDLPKEYAVCILGTLMLCGDGSF